MNNINYGNQKISLNYFNIGTSKSFNQRNFKLLPMGIYSKLEYNSDKTVTFSNGYLEKVNSTTVRVHPFIAEVRDFEHNVSMRIETQEVIDITVSPSEPYIIIKFEYGATTDNYAFVVRSAYSLLVEDYIIIGKCLFDGSSVLQSHFDYSRRHNIDFTFPFLTYNDYPLKVLAQEPMTNKIDVIGGLVSLSDSSYVIEDTELTITLPVISKRVDLIYVNNSGVISVITGVENANPVTPDYENKLVIAEVHLDSINTVINGSNIIPILTIYKNSINSSIPTFDQILLNNPPTENNHAASKEYVDDLLHGLDWQESVLSFLNIVTSEPVTRNVGDRYIATATGTSNITGTAITQHHIYEWTNVPNTHWTDITPDISTTVTDESNGRGYTFNGTSWVISASTVDHNSLAGIQGGTTSQYYHLTQNEHDNIFVKNVDTSTNIAEGTNLFYTEIRVSANTDVAANTAHRGTTGNPHGTAATQISDFDTGVSNNTDVSLNTTHRGLTDNPHSVTKTQVGLGNVDDVKQVPYSTRGIANGVATLDAGTKVPSSQLPTTVIESLHYMGAWAANGASPPSASPLNGEFWIVSVNGTYELSGIVDWKVGDFATYIGTVWRKIDNSEKVTSVNGYDGAITLDSDDINEGSSNLYFTDGRVTTSTTVVDHEDRLDYIESSGHIISYQDIYLVNNNIKSGEMFNELEINGIPNSQLSNFTMSYNSSTRILSLTKISDWYFYVHGKKYDVTSTIDFTAHANTNGLYYFYFTSSGIPNIPSTSPFNISEDCTIALVYYVTSNDGGAAYGTLFNELHGCIMSPKTHLYLHTILRTQYYYGGELTGYTPNTDTIAGVTFQIASARFSDEDIIYDSSVVSDGGNYRLWYYDGTKWNVRTSSIPYFINGSTDNIQYNNIVSGLVDITTNNRWVNYYLALTGTYDSTYNVMIIPGQSIYTSLSEAQNASAANLNLSSLPFAEMVFFKKITLQYQSASSTTTGKAKIVEVANITYNQFSLIGTGSSISHSSLLGRDVAGQHPIGSLYGSGGIGFIPFMGATGLEDSIDLAFGGGLLSTKYLYLSNNISLSNTTSSITGVIEKNSKRWIHNYYDSTVLSGSLVGKNIFIGEEAGNFTMGSTATILFHSSMNIGIGYRTLYSTTLGNSNIAIGNEALINLTIASGNTAIGARSLTSCNSSGNTSIGYYSGGLLTSGVYNLFLGYNSGGNILQKVDAVNSIAIGYDAYTTKNNQVVIGNTNIVETLLRGNVGIGIGNPATKLHVSDGNTVSSSLLTSDYITISAEGVSPGFNIIAAGNSAGYRGVFKATRARGTLSTPTAPSNNDNVFSLLGTIFDGTTVQATAMVQMDVDGTVSAGVAPQRISFYTSETTGAARTEKMRITSGGNILINTTSVGTSSAGVIAIANGTAPTTSPSGVAQLYTLDGELYLRGATTSGKVVYEGSIPLFSGGVDGLEGGEIHIAKSATGGLSFNTHIDVYGSQIRILEGGGTVRGAYIDLTSCAAGASSKIWHEGNFEGVTISAGGRGTITTDGVVAGVNVTGLNYANLNPTSAIDVQGFAGGVSGQFVFLLKGSSADSVTFRHQHASGTQKIVTLSGQDIVCAAGQYVCCLAYYNGTNWFLSVLPNFTSTATAGNLMLRDSAGRAKVADPAAADDIETAGYHYGTPASASASGARGMIKFDATYWYICTATNTWIRVAHGAATW